MNKKIYLNNLFQDDLELFKSIENGDVIDWEMPSFCSGDYQAVVYEDELGLYIKSKDNYYKGCRDLYIIKKNQNG